MRYAKCGILLCGMVMLWCNVAYAELFVCGDNTQLRLWYRADYASIPASDCTMVSKGNTQAQMDIINSANGRRDYLKVVSGLVVVKSQAEKDSVDAALAAQAAATQVLQSEQLTDTLCNALDLGDVNTKLITLKNTVQTNIDTASATVANVVDVGTAKSALMAVLTAMQAEMDMQFAIDRRVTRCVLTLRKLGR